MPRPERGATPAGFRRQLLARLRNRARQEGVSAQRLQQRVAFERLLARLPTSGEWILKGGFGLEMRYGWRNRPTRDIDLRTSLDPYEALARLRAALVQSRMLDHFTFEVGDTAIEIQGAPGGALRLRIVVRLAGEEFAAFHIDLASGDAIVGTPDLVEGSSLLDFADVQPIRFPVYSVAQQLAEKLHAFTLPRAEENTRVKDLVDLVTIAAVEAMDADALRASLRATFDRRSTHDVPKVLPRPPASWAVPFRRLASQSATTPTTNLLDATELAVSFWNPILSNQSVKRWDPADQAWQPSTGQES